jgi:cell division protein FtsQ
VALLLFGVMAIGAVWGVMKLQDPVVLPLKVVRIDGQFRHLERADIVRSVGDAVQGNFFTVDVEAVRNAARRLPWVDRVSVRRVWPDVLDMAVEEQQPLARWGRDQLVNHRGEVFAPLPASIPPGLPALAGPDGSASRVVERYREISRRLSGLGLRVESLRLDSRQAWRLWLGGGLELDLGRADVARRLRRFIRVYPRLSNESGRRLKRVDLRYTNGFSVLWESVRPAPGDDLKQAPSGRRSGGSFRQQRGRV